MATVIVKLGGAAITDKSIADTFSANIDSLVDNIAQVYRDEFQPKNRHLILIHGAGSFGHPPAKRYQVKAGWTTIANDAQHADHKSEGNNEEHRRHQVKFGMALTRQRMLQLHHHLLQKLQDRGKVPVLSVSPYDLVETDQGVLTKTLSKPLLSRVQHLLSLGFVPMLFGDAVLDQAWGSTILSGDVLMHRLATCLPGVRQCVFVTDVAGIFTKDPKRHPDAHLIRQVYVSEPEMGVLDEGNITADVDDVTGSMQSKWQWAKRIMTDAPQVTQLVICEASDAKKALMVFSEEIANGENGHGSADSWTTVLR